MKDPTEVGTLTPVAGVFTQLDDYYSCAAWTRRSARHRYVNLRCGRNDNTGNLNVHFWDRRYFNRRNHNPPRTDCAGTDEAVRILLRSYGHRSGTVITDDGQRHSAVIFLVNRASKISR